MPSKLKKAIGAVKDQTSISLAKVSNNNSANVEVTVLKATSHDVVPIEDKYIQEILTLISSNKSHAASSAQAIAKRIGKTRNWIVVLKSLMLVLRVFQDGDPYFPIEVLHSMKRGAKILNLSNFRDDSNSCPWDYTAFVRTFALYLDERLDCFLTGKLQRRFTYQRAHDNNNNRGSRRSNEPVVRDMKPAMLLDRIHYWQKLLDRAIATTPTGAAKTNRLVLISLYAIVQETYDLYRDISDGLALLLDSFFQLQYQSCVNAFHACVKASKQFEELSSFYGFCKSLGVGRTSEYPSVQKISEELLETLQEFLKDQASFPGRSPPTHLLGGDQTGTKDKDKGLNMSTNQIELASSEQFETASERESAFGSACASLEDLMSVTDQNGNVSPSWSVEQEFYNSEDQPDKPVEDEIYGSNQSLPTLDQPQPPSFDLVTFEEWPPQPDNNQIPAKGVEEILGVDVHQEGTKEGWELVLFESANNQPPIQTSPFGSVNNMFEYSSNLENLFPQSSMPQHQYNPFLQDTIQIECFATSSNASTTSSNGMGNFGDADLFSFPSSHQQVAPTFCAESTNDTTISSTFSAQSLKDGPMAPTFFAINSNEIRAPPTFSLQNADHTTMAPTFSAHNTSNNTMAPTFCKQSPKGSTMSPTLWSQTTTNESTVSPTLCAHNTKYNTMASTFCARNVNETATSTICAQTPYGISISPTFCAWSTSDTTITKAPTVCGQSPKDNTMAPPTFCARDTNETTMTPTFCAPNHNDSQMIPTCSSSTRDNEIVAPTFRAENCNDIILAQTFRADNRNEAYLAPTFRVDNRNDTTLTPTFHAESRNDRFMTPTFHTDNRNDMIVAPTFRADEPSEFTTAPTFCAGSQNETIGTLPYVENDPFASFSNVTTSELMCNGLVNQESLLHQQRLWLEQQNKIIAKHRG